MDQVTGDVDAEASDEDFEDAHETFGGEEDMFESDVSAPQRPKQQPLSEWPVWQPSVCVRACVRAYVRGISKMASMVKRIVSEDYRR